MIAKILRRASPEDFAAQAVNDFQSETAEITGGPEPVLLRSILMVLATMVCSALVLAAVVRLERVVSASGRVISESPTLIVQPFDTSIVRSIRVHPGQEVHKGEILGTLDPTFSTADRAALQTHAERLKAEISRLEAEQEEREFLPSDDSPNNQMQKAIWLSRRAEYRSTVNKAQQLINTASLTIRRTTEDATHFRSRLDLASKVEGMRKELERSLVGSRLNSLLAADAREEISRGLSEAENTIRAATYDLEVQRATLDVYVQQWKSAVIKDLLDRRAEYDGVREDLAKAQKRWEMVDLRAVEDAVVLDVGNFSVGAVVQPGEKLFTLVPTAGDHVVEVDIDAADQGFVVPGQPASIKFAAYRYMEHGMGQGVVETISADSFAPADENHDANKARLPERFYRARIKVTDLPLRAVPTDFHIVPGMTLTTDIVVGDRTIMAYLVEGALRNASEGMREP